MLDKSIDFLLENAGPVIQYRLRKEILNSLTKTEEENFLEQIYQTPYFKLVESYVKPNGYVGIGMHSWDKFQATRLQDGETAARLLSYYAIPKNHPIIVNYINAMRDDEILRHEFSYFHPEFARFERRFMGLNNGSSLMTLVYTVQALLGYGDDDYVKPFQDISLNAFTSVLPLSSLDDILTYKPHLKKKYNYPYIEANQYFPCSYHLAALAYTQKWRTPKTVNWMANAINHINDIMIDDNAFAVKIGGTYQGTGWALGRPIKHFDVNVVDSVMYRRFLTEIAMLGVGCNVEIIRRSMENIEEALSNDGILRFNYAKPEDKRKYYPQWPTAYCDVTLEPDRKKKTAIDCDMTFWAVQFLHFVKQNKI